MARAGDSIIQSHNDLLPYGLPPVIEEMQELLERYLSSPENLPIFQLEASQKLLPWEPDLESLLNIQTSPSPFELAVEKDLVTGEVIGFTEVPVDEVGCPRNSVSMRRAPGKVEDGVKGSPSNLPFWPGGLDLPPLAKIEVAALDGELETVPPGFSHGLDFKAKEKSLNAEQVAANTDKSAKSGRGEAEIDFGKILEFEEDISVWASEPQKASEKQRKEGEDIALEEALIMHQPEMESHFQEPTVVIEISKAPSADTSAFGADPKRSTEFAQILDVTKPITDFHKLVPYPAQTWPFQLDMFQMQAILCLERHDSVFVAAHTSAGKTVVAEYAIALSMRHLARVIYTSPIKALSNQKYREFKATFGDVGLLSGDVQIGPESSCLIMTTEILRSMLYNGSDVIRDVEWVIFDEVHYINDAERGVVWEESLIMLPDHIGIVLLSATVPNILEFADWVGRIKKRKVYVSSTLKRPVPLEHYLYTYTGSGGKGKDNRFLLVDASGNFLQNGYAAAVASKKQAKEQPTGKGPRKGFHGGGGMNPQQEKNMWIGLLDHLKRNDKLPVVAFTLSRNRCDSNAMLLSSVDLTTAAEKHEIHSFIQKCVSRLKGSDKRLPQVVHMSSLMERGIGVHHSGILPLLKEVIEMLFQQGLVKLLFATETFAMGVNMPARTVVFDSTRKHDGQSWRDLHPSEYIQMAGRAGRRGLDATGTVIILCKGEVPETSDLVRMMLGKPTVLQSKFRITYSMILNLLRVEQLRVEDMMKRSFCEASQQRQMTKYQHKLRELQDSWSSRNAAFRPESCPCCAADLKSFCHKGHNLLENWDSLAPTLLRYAQGSKVLGSGRVLWLSHKEHQNVIGVLLEPPSSKSDSLSIFILQDPDASQVQHDSTDGKKEEWKSLLGLVTAEPQLPEFTSAHPTVVSFPPTSIVRFGKKVLKVDASAIMTDWRRRRRLDSSSEAENLLLALKTGSGKGFDWLDPVKDLGMKELEACDKWKSYQMALEGLQSHACISCQHFSEHLQLMCERLAAEAEEEHYRYLISEKALSALPEYEGKLRVLQALGYVDPNLTVQLKGRVACEMGTHELMITELIFENVLTDLPPAEITALLSSLVFQGRKTDSLDTADLPANLAKGVERFKEVALKIGHIQRDSGLPDPPLDFVEQLNFGLVLVVFEWAKGVSFSEIARMTDVQEGLIIRAIQRLEEVLRDVRSAARIVGDPLLFQKMEESSAAIKRDIVFAASLYTQDLQQQN